MRNFRASALAALLLVATACASTSRWVAEWSPTELAKVDGENGYLDGPADIHAVENCMALGAPAASVHVYSRPYAECDIYDLVSGERQRVQMAYDTIAGKPVS